MEALRQSNYRFWIVSATLLVWWLYASMTLCSAFSSMGSQNGDASSSGFYVVERHITKPHAMSMMAGNAVSFGQSISADPHCGGSSYSSGMADSKDLCCDELQEGSASGQTSTTMLFVVTLAWTSYVFEPLKPLLGSFTELAVPIPWPAIYLLVCSFLK